MRRQLVTAATIGALMPLGAAGTALAQGPDGSGHDGRHHEGRHGRDAQGEDRRASDDRERDRRDDRRTPRWEDRRDRGDDRARDRRDGRRSGEQARDRVRDRDHDGRVSRFRGKVTDLDPSTTASTDGVRAAAMVVRGRDGTVAGIRLSGFEPSAAGTRFGAHEQPTDEAGDAGGRTACIPLT